MGVNLDSVVGLQQRELTDTEEETTQGTVSDLYLQFPLICYEFDRTVFAARDAADSLLSLRRLRIYKGHRKSIRLVNLIPADTRMNKHTAHASTWVHRRDSVGVTTKWLLRSSICGVHLKWHTSTHRQAEIHTDKKRDRFHAENAP